MNVGDTWPVRARVRVNLIQGARDFGPPNTAGHYDGSYLCDAKRKAQVMQDQVKARFDQAKREADAKITALQGQLKQARDRQKAKIEKRIAEVKADLVARHAKLQEAGRLAKEALAV